MIRISAGDAERLGLGNGKAKARQQRLPGPRSSPAGSVDDEGITLYVPFISLSNNQLIRVHWARRNREVKSVAQLVMAAGAGIKQHRQKKRARVLLTRVSTGKVLDRDNLTGGLKPMLDALVTNEWLVDDSPKWCDYELPLQLRPTGAQRVGTWARIEYLPDPPVKP